jgi:hypothetical protein
MGIDLNSARFLLSAHASGVDFRRVVTIGRQDLLLPPARLRALLHEYRVHPAASGPRVPPPRTQEEFFALLGAETVAAIDFSDYEGAGIVHDMNHPVADELKERFTAVFDGGSLEHIFDFRTAIRNCMEMVETGGHLLLWTPGNNFLGHGFYQFSPELFYRILDDRNGFRVERLVAVESPGRWYDVADPAKVGERVRLCNRRPVQLIVQARRQRIVPLFAETPQQSDYVAKWNGTSADGRGVAGLRGRLKEAAMRLPLLWSMVRWWRRKTYPARRRRVTSFSNRRYYRPLDD